MPILWHGREIAAIAGRLAKDEGMVPVGPGQPGSETAASDAALEATGASYQASPTSAAATTQATMISLGLPRRSAQAGAPKAGTKISVTLARAASVTQTSRSLINQLSRLLMAPLRPRCHVS